MTSPLYASMTNTPAILSSPLRGSRRLYINQYRTGLNNNLKLSISREGQTITPVKVNQDSLQFLIQCPSREYKTDLQEFLQRVMRDSLGGTCGIQPLRLLWSSQEIDYRGYINSVELGTQRFEVGPTMSFTMTLVKDIINTISDDFSTGGAYTGIFEGEVLSTEDLIGLDNLTPDLPDEINITPGTNRGPQEF